MHALSNDASKTPPTAAGQHTDAAHTYSEGTLQSQVTDLLATKKTGESRSGSTRPWGVESDSGTAGPSGMQPNKTFKDTTVSVPRCIQQAIPANEVVLVADKGVYKGSAVYLVVTPDASDTTKVTAFVVDARCVKQASTSPGKVLLTHSYTRS
ncbi:hypothetical protein [Streptomyces sp. TP-A0356]|uniref:hypothetical protein n=1 Tax=Streptomyces sp. TP-A0356 TaxID=1359208 RepID=UPI00352AF728